MKALESKPYINSANELVIPHTCDKRFHYWDLTVKDRMTLEEVLEYIGAWKGVKRKYYQVKFNAPVKHQAQPVTEEIETQEEEIPDVRD